MVVNGSMRDEKHSQTSIHQHTASMRRCLSRWNASSFFIINKWLISQQKQANIKPAKNTTFELKSNFSVKLFKVCNTDLSILT